MSQLKRLLVLFILCLLACTAFGQYDTKYVADVTLPDHSAVKANTRCVKIWKITNTGSKSLKGLYLKQIDPEKGGISCRMKTQMPDIKPGETGDVSIVIKTPAKPDPKHGEYRATFKLVDAKGKMVQPDKPGLYVLVRVQG